MCVMTIAMSSPVWQMKPSISKPLQIAFATSPSTVAIMREDGFVCPPTEPTSALMTERVSLMSIPPRSAAQRLGACCAGARRCSFAERNVRCSVWFHGCHSWSKSLASSGVLGLGDVCYSAADPGISGLAANGSEMTRVTHMRQRGSKFLQRKSTFATTADHAVDNELFRGPRQGYRFSLAARDAQSRLAPRNPGRGSVEVRSAWTVL